MKVLIGVTGCIAAYKACELVREFQRAGHETSVVMTEAATRFVGLETFAALTQGRAKVSLFEDEDPIPHIALAQWADVFVVAPCTANVCAKAALGIADDLLTSTLLACTCPIFIAPAMNVYMYEAAATQANLDVLRARGVHVLSPDEGYLACGEVGPGKLPDPKSIARWVCAHTEKRSQMLCGKRVLVTSGPTQEPIDAVRFISNRSSGKMGAAIVSAALDAGACVTVISGPVAISYDARSEVIPVMTAEEMFQAARKAFAEVDVAICVAAVADLRPKSAQAGKLKKGRDDEALACVSLIPNPDILSWLGHHKQEGQVVVGFAAETEDVVAFAKKKLASKGADMIVANDVAAHEAFGADDDVVILITEEGEEELGRLSKDAVANEVIAAIASMTARS